MKPFLSRILALLAAASLGFAQGGAIAQQQRLPFTQQQLDQMLAPVALYPDPLLSQILMAATYPLEIEEAARWSRINPHLRGDDAVRAVADEDWDPSVKSLVAFPQVLQRMDENPAWTRSLGDAFLAMEPHVMETVQQLRRKAQAAGTLRSDERNRVLESGGAIAIEPTAPQLVYVPYYDPRVAYGPWWWPAYPPMWWAPWPVFGVRLSVGFFFGAVDWRQRHVRVMHVHNHYSRRPAAVNNVRVTNVSVAPGRWQHEPTHRRGIAYRDPALQARYAAIAGAQRIESRRVERREVRSAVPPATPMATPQTRAAPEPRRPEPRVQREAEPRERGKRSEREARRNGGKPNDRS